ncbi:MAG: SufD family Fe-S cluster assembly protein [Anaerolineae bacterium]|nr:SufD family Fe-S cluster assembly protein [Anaerolineae bacterium]
MNTKPHRPVAPAPGWANEFEALLEAYNQAGGDPSVLRAPKAATLVVSANRVLAANEVPGVHFAAEQLPDGVRARIAVEPAAKFERPVHLCFGMLPAEGVQRIEAEYEIGAGAQVEFIAHCTFPNALRLQHIMDARIHVGPGATMRYSEAHYHGPHGGIEVLPKAQVVVEDGGRFFTSFNLVHGRVGRLEFDYDVTVGKDGVAELSTKAYGHGDDHLRVNETLHLNGEGARGLTKTRIAVRDAAVSEVYTTAEGNAPAARGHMDCTEIVRDEAVARNTPVVIVRDDQAQVTHEASIGSVNRKELETLMARGLDEDAAVDVIIRGMLVSD